MHNDYFYININKWVNIEEATFSLQFSFSSLGGSCESYQLLYLLKKN